MLDSESRTEAACGRQEAGNARGAHRCQVPPVKLAAGGAPHTHAAPRSAAAAISEQANHHHLREAGKKRSGGAESGARPPSARVLNKDTLAMC